MFTFDQKKISMCANTIKTNRSRMGTWLHIVVGGNEGGYIGGGEIVGGYNLGDRTPGVDIARGGIADGNADAESPSDDTLGDDARGDDAAADENAAGDNAAGDNTAGDVDAAGEDEGVGDLVEGLRLDFHDRHAHVILSTHFVVYFVCQETLFFGRETEELHERLFGGHPIPLRIRVHRRWYKAKVLLDSFFRC